MVQSAVDHLRLSSIQSASPQPPFLSMSQLLPAEKLAKLENEFQVLHLIFVHNHNQHRVAVWWRYLNMVHRKVRSVLIKIHTIESTKLLKQREKIRNQTVEMVRYLVRKGLFQKAMYEFHSIIALGQFINLGFTLVGSISAIFDVLMQIDGLHEKSGFSAHQKQQKSMRKEDSIDDIGEEIDLGVEVPMKAQIPKLVHETTGNPAENEKTEKEEPQKIKKPLFSSGLDDMDSIFSEQPRKKHKKSKDKEKKEKKDKKKKKKSAMDDIFG